MKLKLGLSPCPNDVFIFDALLHQKIDTQGLEFDVFFADVEQLNKWSLKGNLDVSKLSFNAFFHCMSKYILIDSGSALGTNCGPLLIKKPNTVLKLNSTIAIPGEHTTANLLLNIACPQYSNKVEILFSEIEENIILDKVDAGLIIHETRFTYQKNELEKVIDLGEFWEKKTGLPLPLGGIAVKRDLPFDIQKKIERVLCDSIKYAFANRKSSLEFIQYHAQEMGKDIIDAHISLYVNHYSLSLGEEGRNAIELLFQKSERGNTNNIFL